MKKNITKDVKTININGRPHSNRKKYFFSLLLLSALIVTVLPLAAQMQMERLNRGVTAVRTSSTQVYIGWRMFGTDPSSISFNVYRGSTKINSSPITNSTNIVDNTSTNSTYTVRPVINGVEQAASESASVWSQQYLSIPLQRPAGGTTPSGENYTYNANDCSVGDLDGDGQYEIILKWDPSNAHDNAHQGYTGNVYIDAYKMNGTRLWRIDLGRNIRAGAHYTQLMVYDLDGDGKAEVACKTAENTRDGLGNHLSKGPAATDNNNADYRSGGSWAGFITSGPEYLTIFNGQTGAEMATTNYLPSRYPTNGWGNTSDNTNRVDRFVAGIAYLDGQRPSLVMGRGYYGRLVRVAWDWRNGQLAHRWTFDSNTSGNGSYSGQGNHQITVGDTDNDGRQEFINGSSAINDNGTGMWANGLGHGDAMHLSDMNPDRAGQELWICLEGPAWNGGTGLALVDARTGGTIWRVPASSGDVGRAMASDIDPRYKGYEMWGSIGGLYTCTGTQITTTKPSINFGIWWDGDLQRELLDATRIDKWNSSTNSVNRLITFSNFGALENNGTKATPGLSADILGDWREEAIFRSSDNTKLLVFTTVIPTTNRIYTLMHDPQYRVAVAWQNTAYNQPPHPGFYLGGGMATPPTPNIVLVGGDATSSIIIQENTTGFCGVEGTVDNNNAGFTGTGFANVNNVTGAGIKWKISVPSTGSYTLTWRHANGSTGDRPARLLINGASVVSNISFPMTGAWTTWTEVSSIVTLNAGENNVRLEATTASGLSNIDYLKISGVNPTALACTGTTSTATDSIEKAGDEAGTEFGAYPNPSGNVFIIRAPASFTYRIFDEFGRTKESGAGENGISVGHELTPGLYILRISTSHHVKTLKVIKK